MKKHFLLVALFMVVFLGLGNNASAVGASCSNLFPCPTGETCMQPDPQKLGTCMSSNSSTPTSDIGTINQGGFCVNSLQCKSGLICSEATKKCITDPSIATNDCSGCRKISTPDELAAGCTSSTENQKSCSDGLYCCPKSVGEPCSAEMSFSNLKGDLNAEVAIPGISCKCKPNYGEYYNVNTKTTTCELCSRDDVCCGVKLNTAVPFIGNCIEDEKSNDPTAIKTDEAFPVLMSSLTKILVTVILIVSFVLIVVGGIMIASAGANPSNASAGKKLIMKVVIGIALLGASGVILRLINPNFFG